MSGFVQKVARSLALSAAMVAAGVPVAAAGLEEIPGEMLESIAEDSDVDHWNPQDRYRLIDLLARDSRPSVRKCLVVHVQHCPLPLADADRDWLLALAADSDPEVAAAFAKELTALLARAAPLERASIVTSWALSSDEPVRLAIARALDAPTEGNGVRTAIRYLVDDPSAAVRTAALRAAVHLRPISRG